MHAKPVAVRTVVLFVLAAALIAAAAVALVAHFHGAPVAMHYHGGVAMHFHAIRASMHYHG